METYIEHFQQDMQGKHPGAEKLGGKGDNLFEMCGTGFPVPAGFVVTTDAYLDFLKQTGTKSALHDIGDINADNPNEVEAAARSARELITGEQMPADIAERIRSSYADVGDVYVAVRSSATAEDLPNASFAGQQETFLDVNDADDVVERVKECWASLFTDRAITYRAEHEFPVEELAIAVVVQRMVEATKSGVIFTSDPNTGTERVTIESAWGLGEAVVSGEISPDNYVLEKATGNLVSKEVSTQTHMIERGDDGDETVLTTVPSERRSEQVLDDDEFDELLALAKDVEEYYGHPQDIEWAIRDGYPYLLQARPITTIDSDSNVADEPVEGEIILSGLDASDGIATGRVCFDPIRVVKQADEDDIVLVRETTSPSDVPGMKAASGIVTNKGGTTSHAAIVARELSKPAVVGCEEIAIDYDNRKAEIGSLTLVEGDQILVDGTNGHVRKVT